MKISRQATVEHLPTQGFSEDRPHVTTPLHTAWLTCSFSVSTRKHQECRGHVCPTLHPQILVRVATKEHLLGKWRADDLWGRGGPSMVGQPLFLGACSCWARIMEYAQPMMMAVSLCTSYLGAGDLEVRIPQRTRVCDWLSPLSPPEAVNYYSGHAFKRPDLSVCAMSVAQQGKSQRVSR